MILTVDKGRKALRALESPGMSGFRHSFTLPGP
jgi:hypothetical protein